MMNIDNENNRTNNSLLWIRFYGPDLEAKSIPIFELGQTLIALQSIIHKSYLFNESRLTKGAVVSKEERRKLALQIIKQQGGSDEYGLIPFLTDPVVVAHLKIVMVNALLALGVYAARKVIKRRKKNQEKDDNQPLVGSIYNQVNVIIDRINNIGGIDHIEITAPDELNVPTIKIDISTQEYVRELAYEPIFGDVEEIEGTVLRLYTTQYIAVIERGPGDYIHVRLSPDDFEAVRYQTDNNTIIRFEGRSIYFLGKETSKFEDFEADRIVSIRKI